MASTIAWPLVICSTILFLLYHGPWCCTHFVCANVYTSLGVKHTLIWNKTQCKISYLALKSNSLTIPNQCPWVTACSGVSVILVLSSFLILDICEKDHSLWQLLTGSIRYSLAMYTLWNVDCNCFQKFRWRSVVQTVRSNERSEVHQFIRLEIECILVLPKRHL